MSVLINCLIALWSITCRTMDGTEKIMASLKIGFVSSLFVEVFFLLIFLPSCRRYTLTNGSDRGKKEMKPELAFRPFKTQPTHMQTHTVFSLTHLLTIRASLITKHLPQWEGVNHLQRDEFIQAVKVSDLRCSCRWSTPGSCTWPQPQWGALLLANSWGTTRSPRLHRQPVESTQSMADIKILNYSQIPHL